jgi:hypothetical protein
MLTLADINAATNSKDGNIYSDLYKDVHGSRPRYAQFASIEEFDADFERLAARLAEQIDEDKIRQDANLEAFKVRVAEIMLLCNCDKVRAVEIIADAEGELENLEFYSYERLEWYFDIKFGDIKQWMAE